MNGNQCSCWPQYRMTTSAYYHCIHYSGGSRISQRCEAKHPGIRRIKSMLRICILICWSESVLRICVGVDQCRIDTAFVWKLLVKQGVNALPPAAYTHCLWVATLVGGIHKPWWGGNWWGVPTWCDDRIEVECISDWNLLLEKSWYPPPHAVVHGTRSVFSPFFFPAAFRSKAGTPPPIESHCVPPPPDLGRWGSRDQTEVVRYPPPPTMQGMGTPPPGWDPLSGQTLH